jgi:molybdenum cofactor synthesis domain-containing protein
MASPTAAFVVIGDEILTGKVQDTNTHTLARVLFERGVRLERVETIPDVVDDIAATVRRLGHAFDLVFTSGGIGPTHDDRTYEGVACAFERKLVFHEGLLAQMAAHYAERGKGALNEARKRMALLPDPCELWQTQGMWVPVVIVENAHVLPGVPQLFEALLLGVAERFGGTRRHRVVLHTDRLEGDIAEPLSLEQARWAEVAIGSYPQYGPDKSFAVMVTLEGENALLVEEIADRLCAAIAGRRAE